MLAKKANQRLLEFKQSKLRPLINDVLFLSGIGVIAVGILKLPTPYAVPGALIFAGAALMWLGMVGARD